MLIAEDSSGFPGVTRAVEEGGLGFDYKWDLGWMHDTLSYFQAFTAERRDVPERLSFSMMYYAAERYLLPLSHDEVVHGKATIAQKMNGDYERKFPQARALYLYMTAHPGKTLDFMGNELAQLREWDERREQDWCLLPYPVHDAFLRFRRELGRPTARIPPSGSETTRRTALPGWTATSSSRAAGPCCAGAAASAWRLCSTLTRCVMSTPFPCFSRACSRAGRGPSRHRLAALRRLDAGSAPSTCRREKGQLLADLPPLSGMLVLLRLKRVPKRGQDEIGTRLQCPNFVLSPFPL